MQFILHFPETSNEEELANKEDEDHIIYDSSEDESEKEFDLSDEEAN